MVTELQPARRLEGRLPGPSTGARAPPVLSHGRWAQGGPDTLLLCPSRSPGPSCSPSSAGVTPVGTSHGLDGLLGTCGTEDCVSILGAGLHTRCDTLSLSLSHIHTHTLSLTHTRSRTCTHTHSHTHMLTHTRARSLTHAHTHTCSRTHTHTCASLILGFAVSILLSQV